MDVSLPDLYWTTNMPCKPNSLGFVQDLCILNDTSVYLCFIVNYIWAPSEAIFELLLHSHLLIIFW